jgi:hypothetical protein
MSEAAVKTYADFILPPSVVTKLDVARLVSEFERVDNDLTSAAVHTKTGAAAPAQPTLSEQLTTFLVQNKFKLGTSQARNDVIKQMRLLKDAVPIVHMTFAVPADPESLQQLAQYLRTSIHPQAVIAVGLQPALIAGVYLRTPNHVHDYSLRGMLAASHGVLVKELETLRASK